MEWLTIEYVQMDNFISTPKQEDDNGLVTAQWTYGNHLKEGKKVAKDPVKAVRYYEMAAKQGEARGHVYYAICLENGEGVTHSKRGSRLHV